MKIKKGEFFKSKNNVFLTGQAGTGKTTLIKEYVKYCRKNKIKVALTSSTGMSAIEIGGTTINRFIGNRIIDNINDYESASFVEKEWESIKKNINRYNVLIIDEISMLKGKMIDLIDHILKKAKESPEPFGGIRVIFVGDFLQLSPVWKSNEEKIFAFESESWKQADFQIINLTKIHRQKNREFAQKLSWIRFGVNNSEVTSFINKISVDKFTDNNSTKIFSMKKYVNELNDKMLKEIKGREYVFEATISASNENLQKTITKDVNAEETLVLKIGARVISLINDNLEYEFSNGSTGIITKIKEREKEIFVEFDNGNSVWMSEFTWELKDKKEETIASFTQFPLKLAYAITIHKSQGMSLESVSIDCKGIFEPSQFYVALSRAKNIEKLYVINFNERHIWANDKLIKFYKEIPEVEIIDF